MENKIRDKWSEIIEYLKDAYEVNGVLFRTWIEPLEVVSYNNGTLVISIDEQKQGDILNLIDKKYKMPLQVAIEVITEEQVNIQFQYKSELTDKRVSSYNKEEIMAEKYPFLNNGHSFDTFVVSGSNNIAYAAALAVAENPNGQIYNPLFLYSGPGLGKTHLIHSIARYIIENHPDFSVTYTTSEDFMNAVVEAIRTNKEKGNTAATANLRKKYRNIDVLLIDDIQFIIGKDSTQIEFFNTFEALYQSGKQLVITSDRPPSQMEQLDMRYRSRFNSGMTIDIQPPDFETSMAILRNKQEHAEIKLDDNILDYIATNIKSNIRDLEGAYNKILLYAKFNNPNGNITLPTAEKALKDFISPNEKLIITADYILEIVADHFSLDKEALLSQKKTRNLTLPRQICMYLCSELTNLTQTEIAAKLKRNNHTTVIHGVNKIKEEIIVDNELANTIQILKKKLNP
ncbi:MAG: chromosomal replication initiator protein DnaA [Eubacterium sp.]|jgi:chromosomal replication initiator protein DnaA|nr:chromosomal replication initiator protein DnaA [Eubacterium sp.]